MKATSSEIPDASHVDSEPFDRERERALLAERIGKLLAWRWLASREEQALPTAPSSAPPSAALQ